MTIFMNFAFHSYHNDKKKKVLLPGVFFGQLFDCCVISKICTTFFLKLACDKVSITFR